MKKAKHISLNDADMQLIERAAKAAGKTFSEFMRDAAMNQIAEKTVLDELKNFVRSNELMKKELEQNLAHLSLTILESNKSALDQFNEFASQALKDAKQEQVGISMSLVKAMGAQWQQVLSPNANAGQSVQAPRSSLRPPVGTVNPPNTGG